MLAAVAFVAGERVSQEQVGIVTEGKPQNPLAGTRWLVMAIYDTEDGGAGVVLPGTSLTMVSGAGGTVNGSADCNTYSSTYVVQGNLLAITLPTATNKLCTEPQGIMEQETVFLALVPTIGSYSIAGSQLTLNSESGQMVLEPVAY